MTNLLPSITHVDYQSLKGKEKRLLILAEGFEKRSISFLSSCDNMVFSHIIVCKYKPEKKSKYKELMAIIKKNHPNCKKRELDFNRYNPFEFELALLDVFTCANTFCEIVVDISVMSKYMIMQILCSLRDYAGKVRVIYSEPISYAPTKEKFRVHCEEQSAATVLPSYGVHDIIMTPLLSSIYMQKSPTLLIAFLSFNEQLIRALLSDSNPMRLLLINGVPPHLKWREGAMVALHEHIIREYNRENKIDAEHLLQRRTSTLNYIETFEVLAEIYRENCVNNRIVIAPTGSKMQTVACSLIRLCCPDVHIEYPTPESYYVPGYSSSRIRDIHEVIFYDYSTLLTKLPSTYKLDR